MSDLIHKIKSFFKTSRNTKTFNESGHIRPSRDWKIILVISFLVVCALSLFSFYFYTEIEKGTFFKIESADSLNDVKINNPLLKKIIENLNGRERALENIKNKTIIIPSPTL